MILNTFISSHFKNIFAIFNKPYLKKSFAKFGGLFFLPENLFIELTQLTLKERLHRLYELDESFRFLYLKDLIGNKWIETAGLQLDCLKSAFSLKIRLVLISSSAIANHDVIITIRDSYFFFSGLRPRFSRLSRSCP